MSLFKIIVSSSLAAMLAACGQSSNSTETVESLAANPERLKELRQQCKLDRAKLAKCAHPPKIGHFVKLAPIAHRRGGLSGLQVHVNVH